MDGLFCYHWSIVRRCELDVPFSVTVMAVVVAESQRLKLDWENVNRQEGVTPLDAIIAQPGELINNTLGGSNRK